MPERTNLQPLRADYVLRGDQVRASPTDPRAMINPRSAYYERAMGFYSEDLRQRIIDGSARIAGMGGGGLTLAVMLAKEGVRDFSIADIDAVDATNVGRIPMLSPKHIGRPKVDVAAELITENNPTATVRVYASGVNDYNVDEFLAHEERNHSLVVGFDEIDLNEPLVGLLFHRAARRHRRYVICATDVERGGLVTVFDPDSRHTFETYQGAKASDPPERFLERVQGVNLPAIANLPKTGTVTTLRAVQSGAPLPTTLRSVLNATDLAMDEFERLLTRGDHRYPRPHVYPRIHCVNPSRNEDFVSRFPRTRSTWRLIQLLARDRLGLNPPTSYSDEDRRARETQDGAY